VKVARAGRRLLRLLRLEGSALDPLRRWLRTRAMPDLPPSTFRDWWRKERP
jgi:hypothetical protein